MPVPADRRADDMQRALSLMAVAVGDEPMNAIVFSPDQPMFEGLLMTTWRELLDAGLIEDRKEKPGPSYRLTPLGWLAGLNARGALETDDVRARAITIRRALKDRVKGRQSHYEAHVDVRLFASEINLPVGWVWNALRANLLSELFPNHMMNATLDHQGLLIRIPQTFDMQQT